MEGDSGQGGPIIALTTEGNDDIQGITSDVLYIPETLEALTPILSVIPLRSSLLTTQPCAGDAI